MPRLPTLSGSTTTSTGIAEFRSQLRSLTLRNLRLQYAGSVLGFFWILLEPFFYMVILSFVFTRIVRFEIQHYSLFLLAGLLPWNFFSHAVLNGTTSITQDANLVKSASFRREVLPASSVLSSFINLLFGLLLLLVVLLVWGIPVTGRLFLLPVLLLAHMLFALGLALLLSSANTFLRDVHNLVGFGLMLWFYLTPVFYPVSLVPEGVLFFYKLNPMVPMVTAYRSILLDGKSPPPSDLLLIGCASTITVATGYAVFRKCQSGFAKVI